MPMKSADKCNLLICRCVETQRAFFDLLEQMKCRVEEITSLDELLIQARDTQLILLEFSDISTDDPPKPYMIYLPENISEESRSVIKIFINSILNESEGNPELFSRKYNYLTLSEVENLHIINMLNRCEWNVKTAAKQLGINRTTLYRKIEKYGITRK
jgi:transcriptional regulator of acetoin/glycerol metabolism